METLNYLVVSDIHLGHPKVPSEKILEHFDNFLKTYHKHLKVLDVIFVLGDITDKPLMNGSHDHNMVTLWFIRLISFAKKNGIEVVMIRGTISHDGKGLESFSKIIEDISEAKYTYVDTIKVLTIKKHNVLIIPDNTHKHGEDVEKYVKTNFLDKGINIDISMVHRAFNFQLPFPMEESLNMDFWLKLTKYYIHVGHIHTPMTYKRIIGQGSFDRLTHGQEEIKGAVMTYIGHTPRWIFLENKLATTFRRLRFEKVDIPLMVKRVKELRLGSFIEIQLPSDELRIFNKRVLHNYTHGYNITFASSDDSVTSNKVLVYKSIEEYDLSPENVRKMLLKRMDEEKVDEAKDVLTSVYREMRVTL